MVSIDLAEFNAAKQAKARAVAFHLYDPNVSLIDVGWRIMEQAGNQVTNQLRVRVHLRRKSRGSVFEAFRQHNPERVIDEKRIGFPVDIVQGKYKQHQWWLSPSNISVRSKLYRPLRGGISISNERGYGYGTLGGKVKDRTTGAEMILSAWHVLDGYAGMKPGLRILQPGVGDGGNPYQAIARFSRHAMNNGIDAAVAELDNSRSIVNDQLELGSVSGAAYPNLGMRVAKSGRTSSITEGYIDGVEGVVIMPYQGFTRIVHHVIHIAQLPEGGEVSAPGDSGSWWLEKSTMKAVGLHFAGDNEPEYGLAIAMPPVLDALNVDIAL